MAGRRGNVRGGHFHLFSRKMEKSLSVCEKITNIRLGQISRHGELAVRDFFSFFLGKRRIFTDRLPKNFEYKAWKVFVTGNSRSGTFFRFFSGNGGFLLSVFQKNLNKGDDGLGAFIGGCQCRAPAGTGDFRKIFEIFSEIRGQNIPLPGNNPDRGTSRRRIRMFTTFFPKSRKNLDRFQKKSEYTVWKVFEKSRKKGE